jgi:hypothetical protein
VKLEDLVNVHLCLTSSTTREHMYFRLMILLRGWAETPLDCDSLIFRMKVSLIWLIIVSNILTHSQTQYLPSPQWHANRRVQCHGGLAHFSHVEQDEVSIDCFSV